MRRFLISLCTASLLLASTVTPLQTGAQQQPLATPMISQRPPTTGSLICSAGIGKSCGTTKADYVGAYKLNMSLCQGLLRSDLWGNLLEVSG